jgi:acyl-coenzyme A synthetase/AMP-(fatty) acid ligase
MKIYTPIYPPPHVSTNLSLPQFLNIYNPDAVSGEKIILEDDWTGKSVSYRGLRDTGAEHAWVLREKFGVGEGDVVAISGLNSVGLRTFIRIEELELISYG